jgi:hypothetical protein
MRCSLLLQPSGLCLELDAFVLYEVPLEGQTTRIAAQLAIAADEAVTGNHNRNWIPAIGMPHSASSLRYPQALCKLPIGQCRAKRYVLECLPDALLKRRAWGGKG